MFLIKIAEIKIAINNKFDLVMRLCNDYIIQSDEFDFCVEVSKQEFELERSASGSNFSDGFIESVCIYRNIAKQLPRYGAFVFHCAAIEKDGNAYCFAARSGVGKTTHIMLWKKVFGDSVNVINGDKPIIRFIDGKPYVCGTPWGGKENLHCNTIVPLRSICFLDRAEENSISEISKHDALNKILHQVFMPKEKDVAETTLDLLGQLLQKASFWTLCCNISDSAAILAYETMSKEV